MLGKQFIADYEAKTLRVKALRSLITQERDQDSLIIMEHWLQIHSEWLETNKQLYEAIKHGSDEVQ